MTYLLCIYLFLLPLFFSASLDDHFFLPKYLLTSLFAIALLIAGIYFRKSHDDIPVKHRHDKIFLGYIFLFSLNSLIMLIFNRVNPVHTVNELTVMLFILVVYVFRNQLNLETAFDWLLFSAGLVSIIGILQYYGFHPLLPKWGIRGLAWTKSRPLVYATLGNPNYLCNFLTPLVPFSLYRLFNSRTRIRGALYTLSFFTSATAIVVSFSRAGIFNLIAGVFLFFGWFIFKEKRPGRKVITSCIIIVVILAVILLMFIFDTPLNKGYGYNAEVKNLRERLFKRTGSIGKRMVLWKNSIRLIFRNPLTGIGDGNFPDEIVRIQADYFENASDYDRAYWSYAKRAHNMFIQKFTDKGLPVGLVFLLLNVAVLLQSLKKPVSKEKIPFFFSFFIILSQGMVSFPLMLPVSAVLYWIIVIKLSRVS